MKRIKYLLFTLLCMISLQLGVKAAPGYNFTVSRSSVSVGGKITASVTVSNTAAWNIKITSSGSTSGCTNSWADATSNGGNTTKTFSTTCNTTSTGAVSFILSGDITSSDGSNISISGTKRVNVTEPIPASTINTLKSLEVVGATLSPEFDGEVLEYNATVASTVNEITINGVKKDNSSSVNGLGTFEISEGLNKFEIVVTAESGAKRTYVVNVTQEDINPINVNVDNSTFTIVKNSKNLEVPNNYVESTTNINGQDVLCFKNETTNLVLLALKDSAGNVYFYTYNEGEYTRYIELSSNNTSINYLNATDMPYKNFVETKLNINGEDLVVYKYVKGLDLFGIKVKAAGNDDNKYYLVYGMDVNNGEKNYYLFDSVNGTYQVFNAQLYNGLVDDSNVYLYLLCGAALLLFICIIIIIILISKKDKKAKDYKKKIEAMTLENNKEDKPKEEIKKETEEIVDDKPKKKRGRKKKEETVKDEDTEMYNILEDD